MEASFFGINTENLERLLNLSFASASKLKHEEIEATSKLEIQKLEKSLAASSKLKHEEMNATSKLEMQKLEKSLTASSKLKHEEMDLDLKKLTISSVKQVILFCIACAICVHLVYFISSNLDKLVEKIIRQQFNIPIMATVLNQIIGFFHRSIKIFDRFWTKMSQRRQYNI